MILALFVPAMTPNVTFAQTVDQQRDEVERIVDELERLEERGLQIAEDYVEALDTKATLDDEIAELRADISVKEAEIAELRSDLGDMAVRAFVGAGTTPLGPLFEDAADINEVLQRDELARVALSAGDITTDELDAFVDDLEDDRASLEDKSDEAARLADSLDDQQDETTRLKTEYAEARNAAEAKLGQLLAEEEARRAAESLARLQAQVAAAEAADDAASSNSGNSNSGSSNSGNSNSGSSNSGNSTPAATDSGNSTPVASSRGATAPAQPEATPAAVATPAAEPAPAPAAPPPSSRASVAVNAALGQQGVPYRYATSSPGVNFDCSGLTKYAWAQAGVYLPHQSRQQYASIPHVSPGNAQPGDLVFYYSPISHVGVYIGNGQHVHAPATGDVVKISTVNWSKVSGVGRPG